MAKRPLRSKPNPADDFGPDGQSGADLPKEELDMIVDEVLGHPQPRSAADRVQALEERVAYLKRAIARNLSQTDEISADCVRSYRKDLDEALDQLAAAQHELENQN